MRDDVAGRWSLTEAAGDAPITSTERATAQIRQTLERHGVVTREVVRSEGTGGGFTAAYGILKAMEDPPTRREAVRATGRLRLEEAIPRITAPHPNRLRMAEPPPEGVTNILRQRGLVRRAPSRCPVLRRGSSLEPVPELQAI